MPRLNAEQRAYTRRLGARIVQHRTQRGWTIQDLSERAEFTWARIWEYEHGRILPGLFNVERLARALDIPVDDLINERSTS